jgi:ribonuclease E
MSIRLDPRRLNTLRALAAEAGVRPGELVTLWVETRLDAERTGAPVSTDLRPVIEALNERVEALAARIDAIAGPAAKPEPEPEPVIEAEVEPVAEPAPRKRGRPRKVVAADAEPAPRKRGRPAKAGTRAKRAATPRTPLHEELMVIIAEQGPMTAAELATAVVERGRYAAPRSTKPLDAATVNARVSNPVYRSHFQRMDGKIGLAEVG